MIELTNDTTYLCNDCDEVFKVYSESGTANFCPSCASRSFEEYED